MTTRKFKISDAEMLDAADVFHALYLIDELVFNTFNPVIIDDSHSAKIHQKAIKTQFDIHYLFFVLSLTGKDRQAK